MIIFKRIDYLFISFPHLSFLVFVFTKHPIRFKKTVGMQAVLKEREKRQKMKKERVLEEMKEDEEEKKNGATKRKGNEISDLVNSLKKRKAAK